MILIGANRKRTFGGYDSDAQAFINAVSTLTVPQQDAVNDLVLDMKAAGVWSKGHVYYPMVGGSATAHKWNLFNPVDSDTAYRGIFGGGWTHNADGAKGNGTNGYLDSKLIPSSDLTDNDTAFVYVSGTYGSNTKAEYGASTNSGGSPIRINLHASYSGTAYSDLYNYLTGRISNTSNGLGVFIASRTSSSVHKLFKDGSQIGATNTGAPNTMAGLTMSLYFNAYNSNGTSMYHSDRLCQGAGVFEGLTDTEVSDLTDAIDDFNTAIR